MDTDTSNIVLWVALVVAVLGALLGASKQHWPTVLAAVATILIAVVLLW